MATRTKQSKAVKAVNQASATGSDPVTALQSVERDTRSTTVLTRAERDAMRSAMVRAPRAFVNAILAYADESGGTVGGVPLDTAAMRQASESADNLALGVTAARSVADRLESQALVAAGGVAQNALGALASLEGYVRTSEGKALAPKAEELRAQARKGRRKPRAKAQAEAAGDTATEGAADTATDAKAPPEAPPAAAATTAPAK